MAYGLVGLYALYFVFVGINSNASKMVSAIESDAKEFAPWLLAIVILKALSENSNIKPLVNPFIGLALVTFVLKNYNNIVSQIDQITGMNLPGGKMPAATQENLSTSASSFVNGVMQ